MRGTAIACRIAPAATRRCSKSARARRARSPITRISTWSRGPALDLVAAPGELGGDRLRDAALNAEPAGVVVVGREGGGVAVAREARVLDRALHVLAVHEDVEQHLQHRLALDIAAWGAEGEELLAIALDRQRRVRGQARPLAGRDPGRVARIGSGLRAARGRD